MGPAIFYTLYIKLVVLFFQVEPAPIAQINFSRPQRGKENNSTNIPNDNTSQRKISAVSKAEEKDFFDQLKKISPSSTILTMIELRSQNRESGVPLIKKLPQPLTALADKKYAGMSDANIALACEDIFSGGINITDDEAAYLEQSTKLQAQCLLWHKYRIGRITASNFAAVSKARLSTPPMSLTKKLMGETSVDFNTVPALK